MADGRPFPSELVIPLFLAVSTARELSGGLAEESANARFGDNQARLGWIIDVEGLGRVGVRRGPTP